MMIAKRDKQAQNLHKLEGAENSYYVRKKASIHEIYLDSQNMFPEFDFIKLGAPFSGNNANL